MDDGEFDLCTIRETVYYDNTMKFLECIKMLK